MSNPRGGITIDIFPTLKQQLAWQKWMDRETQFLLFGGSAGGGKTWWLCEKQIVQAYTHPGAKSFIARKELKRLMASTYVTFTKVAAHHRIPEGDWKLNGQYNYIEFKNGTRIDLLDLDYKPSDPLFERLGSLEYTNGDIDEAGEVHSMAFDVLKSRVGRHLNKEFGLMGKIGLTCNPSKNFLYQLFYKPWKDGTLPPNYAFIPALYKDNPHTVEEYGRMLESISDKATKERLMYGNWEYDDDPATLMDYDSIVDLFTNTVDTGEKFIVADVARYGKDTTKITLWDGLECYRIIESKKQGTDQTVEKIKLLAQEERVPYSHIIVDEDGVGGGVVDQLRGIKGFIANSTPFPSKKTGKADNFANLKAQCAYTLADYVNAHRMAIKTDNVLFKDQLIEDLEQIKSKDLDKDAKRKIVSKDEVKEKLGRSPDLGDCLIMRMWFELGYSGVASQFVPRQIDRAVTHYPNARKGFWDAFTSKGDIIDPSRQ